MEGRQGVQARRGAGAPLLQGLAVKPQAVRSRAGSTAAEPRSQLPGSLLLPAPSQGWNGGTSQLN